ncbi:unnamed protein product [Medioppia subpectinata]|uniref:Solute carrier organic anion transporter family member n=1 Tax=Medioppia subpectinata TaxID=1979941 RepID=A0A7R9KU88_9ACAR|nr:unnamed protein product [Medioppia subpectinata]CAG2108566.1 unnamed protein product [Medioppia subpectinata]
MLSGAKIGANLSYHLCGQLLQHYVDTGINPHLLIITPDDSGLWVGRWWLGFMVASLASALLVIPVAGLPARLSTFHDLNDNEVSETYGSDKGSDNKCPTDGQVVGEWVAVEEEVVVVKDQSTTSFWRLARNWPYVCVTIASDCLVVTGLAAFGPKIVEQQFRVGAGVSALAAGVIGLSGAGGGNIAGSFAIKRYDMSIPAIMRFSMAMSALSLALGFGFAISCPEPVFAGVNTPYGNGSTGRLYGSHSNPYGLVEKCNEGCGCRPALYDPVCDGTGVQYYSPCYAGWAESNVSVGQKTGGLVAAARHLCPHTCPLLPLFLVAMFGLIFVTFMSAMPALTATLRCVEKSQKSVALGVQWFTVRLIGSIPAPLLFGRLIDHSCILWQPQSPTNTTGTPGADITGSCLVYDNRQMAYNVLILTIVCKCVTLAAVVAGKQLYKPAVNSVHPSHK